MTLWSALLVFVLVVLALLVLGAAGVVFSFTVWMVGKKGRPL